MNCVVVEKEHTIKSALVMNICIVCVHITYTSYKTMPDVRKKILDRSSLYSIK